VLAAVLPQVTSQLYAANLDDPDLAALYAQTYAAFRRRRSLLLLNLEHQVRIDELPWVAALAPLRTRREGAATAARQALRQVTLLALTAFPSAILPNPLISEMGALTKQADLPLPLVEEVAADIFMGTFTTKWRQAAAVASDLLTGTLYARYYDLPDAAVWAPAPKGRLTRWGQATAEDFARACEARAAEAGQAEAGGSRAARNGTILEQSQILTTHNLAVLVSGLGLTDELRELAPDLADRTFSWLVRRQLQPAPHRRGQLQMIKNVAYAWRQAIFYLSFCPVETQVTAVARLANQVFSFRLTDQFGAAVDGLAHVAAGGRFNADGFVPDGPGRRLLGWTTSPHWALVQPGSG
jgi:hypothetical protein